MLQRNTLRLGNLAIVALTGVPLQLSRLLYVAKLATIIEFHIWLVS